MAIPFPLKPFNVLNLLKMRTELKIFPNSIYSLVIIIQMRIRVCENYYNFANLILQYGPPINTTAMLVEWANLL